MKALATPAICSRSGAVTSSLRVDPPHAPAPEIGMARTDAERMRFIATLLVTAGMKRFPHSHGRCNIPRHQIVRGEYSNVTRHRQRPGNIGRRPAKVVAASRSSV